VICVFETGPSLSPGWKSTTFSLADHFSKTKTGKSSTLHYLTIAETHHARWLQIIWRCPIISSEPFLFLLFSMGALWSHYISEKKTFECLGRDFAWTYGPYFNVINLVSPLIRLSVNVVWLSNVTLNNTHGWTNVKAWRFVSGELGKFYRVPSRLKKT